MIKDEMNDKIIKEFVGLRTKLYEKMHEDVKEEKKCKGIRKAVTENAISHKDYKSVCLRNLKKGKR